MIAINESGTTLHCTVLGQFTLGDFREFEASVIHTVRYQNLLFDLREMTGFTIDMVLEEVSFSRAHNQDFRRIAIVTASTWVAFGAWLDRIFIDTEMQVFDSLEEAQSWLVT